MGSGVVLELDEIFGDHSSWRWAIHPIGRVADKLDNDLRKAVKA